MSKIALSPNISGTGTLTIASPNTNSDRTLTLPDSTGTIATAESTLAQFSASGSAPVFAARAWVNFNGTGTVAIRASGNVSSITDNGTGQYAANFTTALSDTNYAATTNGCNPGGAGTVIGAKVNTVNSVVIECRVSTAMGTVADEANVYAAVFR